MKNLIIIFLSIIFVACNGVENGCNTDEMQNNYKSFSVCSDRDGVLRIEHQVTTKINTDSDVGDYLKIMKGDHTIFEYIKHSHATNATDVTGEKKLVLIVDRNKKFSTGEIIKIPSNNIKGIGVLSGAWIGYNQFDDITGKIKIIDAQKNSVKIEIIDSLYSVKGISSEDWDGKNQIGINHPYSITGKIRFNK